MHYVVNEHMKANDDDIGRINSASHGNVLHIIQI